MRRSLKSKYLVLFSGLLLAPLMACSSETAQITAPTTVSSSGPVSDKTLSEQLTLGSNQLFLRYLEAGGDPNRMLESGKPPLFYALLSGNPDLVRLLVSKGALVNAHPGFGLAPLAQVEDLQIASLLIELGADPNQRDAEGYSPFHHAIRQNRFHLVKLLLEKGADLGSNSSNGAPKASILFLTQEPGLLKLLIEAGASTEGEQERRTLLQSVKDPDLIELLINKGLPVDTRNHLQQTALHTVESPAVASRLLASGADPEALDHTRTTPLQSAAAAGRTEIFQFLLKELRRRKPDKPLADWLAIKNDQGRSLLHEAASVGQIELLELLLANQPDLNAQTLQAETALQFAIQNDYPELALRLLDAGANPEPAQNASAPLLAAVSIRNLPLVERLLSLGADPNLTNAEGENALHRAAVNNHYAMIRLLVEKGVDLNHAAQNASSPFVILMRRGNLEMVRYLADKGADLNANDWWQGGRPLQIAAGDGWLDIVRFLVESGKLESPLYQLQLAKDEARRRGQREVEIYLADKLQKLSSFSSPEPER